MATNPPDHMQSQPSDAVPGETKGTIYLPRLVADEYGMAEGNAYDTVMTAQEVTFDGERYEGDRLAIPYDDIAGKEVVVQGQYRSVRFTYNG